jgi:tRNA-uridine 2-sulfurtransferase
MAAHRGKVVVAMSGGVDSSVAACLLHEQGYEVVGLFMCMGERADAPSAARNPIEDPDEPAHRHIGCCTPVDSGDARAVAGLLGIPFFSLNFREEFDRIIDYFAAEYARGRTPNPCVKCNQQLKFGRLAEYGTAVGADFIATGHYARIDRSGDQCRLRRAVNVQKDQSYVLFGIGRPMLSRTVFPVGELTKEGVRGHARRFGLRVSEKAESQDICFAPDRDYARIVRERRPEAFVEGAIVDAEGKELGRHPGFGHFTVGQRRGLNVAVGVPIYVTRIDAEHNVIVVGGADQLGRHDLMASGVEWLVDVPRSPFRAEVKIRYIHPAAWATVEPLGDDRVRVVFDEPQMAITPGQAAVFYEGDVVLGGGWID